MQFGDYIMSPPSSPKDLDLPFTGFFHQDMLIHPKYDYRINLIRTIQPTSTGTLNLILDIDVFLEKSIADNNENIMKHLEEMRFLKNSVFFNSITTKTLEMLK